MPKIPTLDDLDFSKLPKFELPEFDLSKFELPKFDLPTFELPKFDVPGLEDVELPTPEQIATFARDAAYVGLGLAVMTAERVQALQEQVVDLVKSQVEKATAAA